MNPQVIEVLHGRNNPGIDPGLHAWGWEVPVYLFLGGLVAGLMVLMPLLEMQTGEKPRGLTHVPLAAFGMLSVGMLALLADLEYPTHVYRLYFAIQPASPMSWGSWTLLLVYPTLVALWLGAVEGGLRERLLGLVGPLRGVGQAVFDAADAHRGTLLWASVAIGVGVGTYTGLLLGTMASRPQWNTAVLGPLFLTSGTSTAAAMLLLLPAEARARHLLVRWDSLAIAVELVLLALMLVGLSTGSHASQLAAAALLGGPWTPWFWSIVVILGLMVPLSLNLLEIRRHLPMTVAGPVLVLFGGFVLRVVLVYAGQETSFAVLP